MSDVQLFRLVHPEARRRAVVAVNQAQEGYTVMVKPTGRTLEQNAVMWSCLSDLSDQVTWFGKKLTKEGWKDFITGHLDGQDLHPNMDGTGFISIQRGRSTSAMSKRDMIAVIDLAHAFGSDKGVNWSPTSLGREPAPTGSRNN